MKYTLLPKITVFCTPIAVLFVETVIILTCFICSYKKQHKLWHIESEEKLPKAGEKVKQKQHLIVLYQQISENIGTEDNSFKILCDSDPNAN